MRPHGLASAPAHDTERRAIRPAPRASRPAHKKRRPSTKWRWALQQLIHRGSGSTDSTMSSHPPQCSRRSYPLNYVIGSLMTRALPHCRHARPLLPGPADAARRRRRRVRRLRFARRHQDPEVMLVHLRTPAVHPRRPNGTCRPRASRVHVARNEPDLFGWNGKPRGQVAAINGEANIRAGRRFRFAT
ncbi:hypothetical protein PI86_04410 [Burkholderia sp. A9]|nr:hypothetical protein PI86_04410 [Burkholderia sp. A9]